jgi:cytochrome c
MKKILLIVVLAAFSSCQKEEKKQIDATTAIASVERGEALFIENNCTACHQPDQKVVGPSLQQTAKIYKEQKGNMVAFLKEEAPPIVDESMYESMKINLQLTKMMSDEELQSLEMYILSNAK